MNTEPEYRLVADENDPLTMDAVAGVTRPPVPHIEGDPLSENYEAAKRVATLLLGDVRDDIRDDSERLSDVLSDMFHLCDLLGLDMDHLVDMGQRNYGAEIRGVL